MPRARYKQLVDHFASAIRSGNLPPGTRLPTHRKLAAEHNLALVTASRVYAELEQMGLVSGETGRGTFVRETSLPQGHGIDQQAIPEGMIDLNFNSPSVPGQTALLRHALRQLSVSGDLESLLHYQPHAGRLHERAILARHLRQRGLSANAEQLLILNGAQQGLAVTVTTFLNPGDVVAVDALTYSGFKVLAELHRLELVAIPLTESGPDLLQLEALCKKRDVKAIYSMPTLHNPMGWVMPLEQRELLVKIAREHKLLIIEDAAYSFLEQNASPPLAMLAPDLTVYVSGLSKNVATGLRIGFVVASPDRIPAMERTIRATTWNTPALMSAIVCNWIEDGTVTRLEQDKRQDAAERQAMAREILQGFKLTGHPNSYFVWLTLPEDARADQIVKTLMEHNVMVSSAEPFATSDYIPHALRLALGSVALPQLQQALIHVKQVIDPYNY